MEEKVRVHAIIQGRVQGVFFRKETQHQATARHLTGWVKNRADGSVEAVFEGRRKDVEAVVRWCEQGPPAADVVRVEAVEQPYTGEFGAFLVTY
ncbi:acylphosphatase [Desulfosudis oleivorans]|uniref:Acylphosphatase n=1 Tax=Desulfosudis oleivorans (strain DSM 6200 / JCM 39069 / Hxd3) TaxID=96561 RepID=A9A0M0_DESOH|nr:acylphosphatase [Desulfosudis oleivorans]ABW67520.1 acylphosphatase [Desulfosudis oleivorans Hxd3]